MDAHRLMITFANIIDGIASFELPRVCELFSGFKITYKKKKKIIYSYNKKIMTKKKKHTHNRRSVKFFVNFLNKIFLFRNNFANAPKFSTFTPKSRWDIAIRFLRKVFCTLYTRRLWRGKTCAREMCQNYVDRDSEFRTCHLSRFTCRFTHVL